MASIEFSLENCVAYIRLNRPDKFNSFNREMVLLLQQQLDFCANDKNIRAVYLTGNGRAFSAGQDLAELTGENPININVILYEHFNPIIEKIRSMPKPVIAAVNGVAAGAGANIALSADIVVAKESASFIQAFSKIGLIPDSGGTWFLPRLIGFQKASALMMTGDKVLAHEAERMGMIYKVFADDDFEKESKALAEKMAAMPTLGLAFTKEALNQSFGNTLKDQLFLEDITQRRAAGTKDYAEGIEAFLEKRKPEFKGE